METDNRMRGFGNNVNIDWVIQQLNVSPEEAANILRSHGYVQADPDHPQWFEKPNKPSYKIFGHTPLQKLSRLIKKGKVAPKPPAK